MSEVEKYRKLIGEHPNSNWCYVVRESDFDRVTAERDALQAELAGERRRIGACINQIEEQQQRLTAADERADVLEGLLAKYYNRSDVCAFMAKDIGAALKPAEGGGDEAVNEG